MSETATPRRSDLIIEPHDVRPDEAGIVWFYGSDKRPIGMLRTAAVAWMLHQSDDTTRPGLRVGLTDGSQLYIRAPEAVQADIGRRALFAIGESNELYVAIGAPPD